MNLEERLEKQLQQEQNFITDEGEIKKWIVINYAQNHEERLIALLIEDKVLKERFFKPIQGHWVFDYKLFVSFMENKNYFNDSYTRYKNKVGLQIGHKYLKQRNEVSLVWPFKDCILEGGQTREEQKRDEIFFNEILAQDEINQLLEPKVLTKGKRYTKDGEEKIATIKRDEDGTIRENLIIKGNNLLALHSIKEQFRGKVKLIYIDPPYNTGNDGFGYNDSFNHSSWLTFMKNRLEVALELLREDGVIFVQCDDNEQAYLKVLMDEVFGRENFVNHFSWINNLKGRQIASCGAAKTHEFILCYGKNPNKIGVFNIPTATLKNLMPTIYKGFEYEIKRDNKGEYVIKNELYNTNSIFNEETRPSLVFNIHYNLKTQDVKFSNVDDPSKFEGYLKISPRKNNDGRHKYHAWRWSKEKIKQEMYNLEFRDNGKIYTKVREFKTTVVKDIIANIKANGNDELRKMMKPGIFRFPKPEDLLYLVIAMATQPEDLVLDYHLGSGTTAAVAHKMRRQYIGIEQMDYIEDIAVERLKKVIGKPTKKKGEIFDELDYDKGGISEQVKWKGGDSFLYLALKKHNEDFIEQIQKAKDTKELLAIWEAMKEKSFLDYNLDLRKHDAEIEEFKKLALRQQKRHLAEVLDKNQMYVNLSSLDDGDFQVSKEDKELTREFYQIK